MINKARACAACCVLGHAASQQSAVLGALSEPAPDHPGCCLPPQLCGQRGIPLLFLQNITGFMVRAQTCSEPVHARPSAAR